MPVGGSYIAKLVAVTTGEFDQFHEIDESDEPLRSRIDRYCDEIGISRPADIDDFAWSATFISWCVKTAGATASEFKFNPTHAVFVKQAIANADSETGVFRARSVDGYAPKVGDLIHRNRSGGRITYKQARTRSNYISHSAIVVDIVTSNGSKFAVTIGGNEGDSIRRQRVRLNATGHVQQTQSNPYISVIENLKLETSVHESMVEPADADSVRESMSIEALVCAESGEPEAAFLESAAAKPPTRQEFDHAQVQPRRNAHRSYRRALHHLAQY